MKKLGFGLMRLPMLDENTVDIETTSKMVDEFIDQGFTYFDTAWMYCNFKSEEAIKEALVKRYPRDAYTLTTKLHTGFFNSEEERDHYFEEQLRKTGVDYFDYYLLHDMGAGSFAKFEKYNCFEWLQKKKEEGIVKHIGFSFHDTPEVLDDILTKHPEMEYVQLQINYLDWESEGIQSRKCYEVATKHGKPVIVMEPVKGGTLANVTKDVEEYFKSANSDMSVASWAIRFAASLDNVWMVLSGMSNMEQMKDNLSYMKDFKPLTEDEKKFVLMAADLINKNIAIPCTGCEYCVSGCPMKIQIPKLFALYNADLQEYGPKGWFPQGTYYDRLTSEGGKASTCAECGMCEKACPQHLNIREELKKVAEHFEK